MSMNNAYDHWDDIHHTFKSITSKRKREKAKLQELLTGLAFSDLNTGTIMTVTAKKVRVSNPKSLITSTAPATS